MERRRGKRNIGNKGGKGLREREGGWNKEIVKGERRKESKGESEGERGRQKKGRFGRYDRN